MGRSLPYHSKGSKTVSSLFREPFPVLESSHPFNHIMALNLLHKSPSQAPLAAMVFSHPYHPYSSGKVEQTNHSLKDILIKLSQELHTDWLELLPLALLQLRVLPKKPLISPFELTYGGQIMPPGLTSKPSPLTPLLHYLRTLIWNFTNHHWPQPLPDPLPFPINTGNLVLLSPPGQNSHPLASKWTGLFRVILTTPTAAKIKDFPHWINLSHLKPFLPSAQNNLLTPNKTLPS